MRICPVNNFNYSAPKRAQKVQNNTQNAVNFTANNEGKKSSGLANAAKGTIVGMILLPVAASTLTSCDDPISVNAEASTWIDGDTTVHHSDTTIWRWVHTDTIKKWDNDFVRPQPLDSIFNNFGNWDIDGADGDKDDPNAKRNVTHYEGIREWEYMTKETGDMNFTDFPGNKKILVYDTEIKDWKGNHLSYGKQVLRIPETPFTVTDEKGRTINSPKGFFVESWVNNSDVKGATIADCSPVSRVFCQTDGDTLRVARQIEGNKFSMKGAVAKGYLGDNTLLLSNLIGVNPTDDHITNFKIEAVDDKTLKEMYMDARAQKYVYGNK